MAANQFNSPQFASQGIPHRTQLRRTQLFKHINLSGKGLEIGPYGSPTIFKSEADISYLDWKTRDQLIAESTSPDEIESIPETDYLVASNDYSQYVFSTFDYIIANHVLEHVPDLIRWFSNISAMLNPNGIFFIALPDKKFTFDRFRQDTSLSHILNDYYEGAQRISQEHILEQTIYYDLSFTGQPLVASERLNRARIDEIITQGYQSWMIGYHCHVFQNETIIDKVLNPLIFMGYLDFEIIDFIPPSGVHFGEMMIVFKKTWPRFANNNIDISSFYESDVHIDGLSRNPRRVDKGGQGRIAEYLTRSKFFQKYIGIMNKKRHK